MAGPRQRWVDFRVDSRLHDLGQTRGAGRRAGGQTVDEVKLAEPARTHARTDARFAVVWRASGSGADWPRGGHEAGLLSTCIQLGDMARPAWASTPTASICVRHMCDLPSWLVGPTPHVTPRGLLHLDGTRHAPGHRDMHRRIGASGHRGRSRYACSRF